MTLGRVRLATYANYAVYIGKTGLHMTVEQFTMAGFDAGKSISYDDFDLQLPSRAGLSDLLFVEVNARMLVRIASGQPPTSAAMVDAAYRLFLGRPPENGLVIRDKMAYGSPIYLVHDFLSSFEFRWQVSPGLDLCSLVLDRPKAVGEAFQSTETTPPERELKVVAASLFSPGDEEAIADVAAESFKNRHELLIRLLGHRAFRGMYAS